MGTEELKITDLGFSTPGTITVLVKNTGTTPVTLAEAWINGVKNSDLTTTVSANNQTTISLTYTWTAGDTYEVKLTTSKGNAFIRTENAPS
jgi:archaellum component FlaG (FlaF/FlaG flagellin family)